MIFYFGWWSVKVFPEGCEEEARVDIKELTSALMVGCRRHELVLRYCE
jgi:hypothetical protein